jgi:hypothetical protein
MTYKPSNAGDALPTPRTDAVMNMHEFSALEGLARQLERELAEAKGLCGNYYGVNYCVEMKGHAGAHKHASATRASIIEECAKVCDAMRLEYLTNSGSVMSDDARQQGAGECARQLRMLARSDSAEKP